MAPDRTRSQRAAINKRKLYEDVELMRRRLARMAGDHQITYDTMDAAVSALDGIVELVGQDEEAHDYEEPFSDETP